jgi:tetratricopeptide (TPR) repeat protein
VSAELTRVADGARLWRLPPGLEATSLLAAGGLIAEGAAAAARPGQTAESHPALSSPGTSSEEAYRRYLEGLSLASQLTVRDVATAAERFEQAATIDPQFTSAHAALARHALLPASATPTPDRVAVARRAAERALVLDPNLGTAHASKGMALTLGDWDWSAAGEEFRRAVLLSPNDPEIRLWQALYWSAIGRHDEAIREAGLAVELDPTGPRLNFYRGLILLMARRYDEAIAQFRQTPLELGVITQQIPLGIAVASTKKMRYDQAREALSRIMKRAPSPQARAHLALVLAESGDRTGASLELKAAQDSLGGGPRSPLTMIAAVQACLGQTAEAFDTLERALEEGDGRVVFAKVDPALDCARSTPAFGDFLRRIGLAR